MSTYPYVNGDGLADLNPITPVGASDPVSDLAPAIQQIKKFLLDPANGNLFKSIGQSAQFKARSSSFQVVPTSAIATKLIVFDTEDFDLDSIYDPVINTFVAKVKGIYNFWAGVQVDNAGSVAATLQLIMRLARNNNGTDGSSGSVVNIVPSPAGNRWWINTFGKVSLNVGDSMQVWMQNSDGTNTANTNVSNGYFCGELAYKL